MQQKFLHHSIGQSFISLILQIESSLDKQSMDTYEELSLLVTMLSITYVLTLFRDLLRKLEIACLDFFGRTFQQHFSESCGQFKIERPRWDLNPQSPAPEADALSIRPLGLHGMGWGEHFYCWLPRSCLFNSCLQIEGKVSCFVIYIFQWKKNIDTRDIFYYSYVKVCQFSHRSLNS